jgi:hypothetical protein
VHDLLFNQVNKARDALDFNSLTKHAYAAAAEAMQGEIDLPRIGIGKLDDITSQYPELYEHPAAAKTLKDIQDAQKKYEVARYEAPSILAIDGYKGKPFIGADDANMSLIPLAVDKGKLAPNILLQTNHWALMQGMVSAVKTWGDDHNDAAYEDKKFGFMGKYRQIKKDVVEYTRLVSDFKGADSLFLLSALKETGVSTWIVAGLKTHGDVNKELLLAEYAKHQHMASTVAKLRGFKSMGDGFYKAAGEVLDNLLPSEGTKGKAQINVNIPIAGGGAITIGFEFKGEAERGEGNKLKARFELGATVTGRLNLLFFKAFLRARLFGYLEAQGDNGLEVFRLMAMAMEKRVRSVPKVGDKLANAIFSDYTIAMAEAGMDKDDYVESGMGLAVSGGFGSGDGSRGVSAGAQVTSGTRMTKGQDGFIKSTGTSQFEVSASLKADPFELGGKFTLQWMGGKLNKVEVTQWLSGQIAGLTKLIKDKKRLAESKGWDAQKIGLVGQALSNLTSAELAGAKGADAALRKIKSFQGVKLGHKATLKGGWERGKGASAEFIIERYGKIEIGDAVHSTVALALEGTQRVMRAKAGA